MPRLEEIVRGATIRGILPSANITVVDLKWIATTAIELTYKDALGSLANALLFDGRQGLEPKLKTDDGCRRVRVSMDCGLNKVSA